MRLFTIKLSVFVLLPAVSILQLFGQRIAFYYLGAGKAILLDELNPSWEKEYFNTKLYLEKYFVM